MPVVAFLLGIVGWLGRLGPWLVGLLPAFFTMLGVREKAARVLGIAVKWAIVLAVAAIIPLPDWLTDLPTKIASLPASFFWFAELVQLRFAVLVVGGAYVFRWGWRIFTKAD